MTKQFDRDEFWNRTMKVGDCLEWQGDRTTHGYGVVGRGGVMERSHRVAWELTNGPIPDGAYILHSCDNKPCCNPDHLFVGDHQENMTDWASKGLAAQKLTPEDVAFIRTSGWSMTQLAEKFRVTPNTIGKARRGESFAWITDPAPITYPSGNTAERRKACVDAGLTRG